jgi:membrane-bound serine protease (ClpP class)
VGKEGTAVSTLRPAGIALINNQRVDVVSEGGYIEQGTSIRVLEINGPRVIVARIK